MAVGGIALKKVGDVQHVFEDGDHPGFFPAALIALGALVFVIAFFGCCGAIRESRKLRIWRPNDLKLTKLVFRMPLEPLLALPARHHRSPDRSRRLCARVQPGHPASCLQGMGPLVGWT